MVQIMKEKLLQFPRIIANYVVNDISSIPPVKITRIYPKIVVPKAGDNIFSSGVCYLVMFLILLHDALIYFDLSTKSTLSCTHALVNLHFLFVCVNAEC